MTTFNSYTLLVMGDDIKISNLTIQNSSCNEGQAVSLMWKVTVLSLKIRIFRLSGHGLFSNQSQQTIF
jgi:pectin methylesterase-like acyl-CoA thioesterase